MLDKLSNIYVQNVSDKINFEQLTTHKVQVMGNLKFDQIPPKQTTKISKKMRDKEKIRPMILDVIKPL